MFCLLIESRFAAFRPFITGSFRPTTPFITPSAAYGLLLNLAGIEMREDDGKSAMTLIKKSGLPEMDIALGAPVANKPWKQDRSLEKGESSVFRPYSNFINSCIIILLESKDLNMRLTRWETNTTSLLCVALFFMACEQ